MTPPAGPKDCARCGASACVTGRRRHCDACRALGRPSSSQAAYAGRLAKNFKAKYRITIAQYEAMRTAQGARCAICGRHEDDCPGSSAGRPRLDGLPSLTVRRLVVDHDHATGVVRGLLCFPCNQGLGHFRDDRAVVRGALLYLERAAGYKLADYLED